MSDRIAGLGWRRDLEDHDWLRATGIVLPSALAFKAPEEIDLRGWLKVEDQGQMGSCAGNSLASCEEVLAWIKTGKPIQLSRMFAYLAAQRMSGIRGDQGATITGAIQAAMKMGCCYESTFPYPQQYTSNIPEAAIKEAKPNLVRNHSVLNSYAECFNWLAAGVGAIQIGIAWTSELANNKSGVIETDNGQNYGGHALAVVGFSKRTDSQGRRYLWMVNSHGLSWGRSGWAEVAPRLFDKWCREQQSEVIGITDLAGPIVAPRELTTWIGTGLVA